MSRIGKKIIELPANTEITVAGTKVSVKGPKGILEREISSKVTVVKEGNTVKIALKDETVLDPAWGTAASHIVNMIQGVNEPFTKKLIIEGIGYKAEVKGTDLGMSLGFSHPVVFNVPQIVTASTEKDTKGNDIIVLVSINKEVIGETAAKIRKFRPPECYKGKGVRYSDEKVIIKETKKK